jgi:predicted nucleotidyltransferase
MGERSAARGVIPAARRRQIGDVLRRIERRERVRILLAVESGSRAWGFASPDSDYDVRFVYARPLDWYLSLQQPRDVIELPIDDLLDVNGWDIQKALRLACKPNPVLLEWLQSPIVYRRQAGWLRANPGLVPMDMARLRAGVDLPAAAAAEIDRLLAAKQRTRELGEGPRFRALDDFMLGEFALAEASAEQPHVDAKTVDAATALFRALVRA